MISTFSTTDDGKRARFQTAAYVCSRLKEDVEALEKVRSILKASFTELEAMLASFQQDATGGNVLFGEWIRQKIKDVIPEADPCAGMADIQISSHLIRGCYTLLCPGWVNGNDIKAALKMRKMNGGSDATMPGEFQKVLVELQSSLNDKYQIAKGVKLTESQFKDAARCKLVDKTMSLEFDWYE